jgi:hypothetical protein
LSTFSPPEREKAAMEKVVARVAIASCWVVSYAPLQLVPPRKPIRDPPNGIPRASPIAARALRIASV